MDIQEEDYQKAVAVVRKCVSGSVSNLQRKLYWGYGRAASAIDRMQDEFIVSTMSASGRRDVYPEEIHELWKELQAAKAQKVAVPEGFVLVEKDLIQSIHQSCVNCLDIDFKPVFKAAVSTIRDSVKPLTESQGQIDISKFDGYTPMLSRSKERVG